MRGIDQMLIYFTARGRLPPRQRAISSREMPGFYSPLYADSRAERTSPPRSRMPPYTVYFHTASAAFATSNTMPIEMMLPRADAGRRH